MRFALTLAALLAAGTAAAAPAPDPLTTLGLPAIQPGIGVQLDRLVTIPAEPGATAAPLARINYVIPVPDATGRLFVADVDGQVFRTSTSGAAPSLYFDLQQQGVAASQIAGGTAHGLQSIAFHPNFNGDPALPGYGKFYTSYTTYAGTATLGSGGNPGAQVAIREWTTDPTAATYTPTAPSRLVMQIAGYSDDHSSGLISFNTSAAPGSADYGNLYIGSGDGLYNDGNQKAQQPGEPQGKMLRINPLQSGALAYTIPAGNPFVGAAGTLPEIWATGLRYPQSFGWDKLTGKMYINDLGQAYVEEVDLGVAGANYGWSQREGTFATGYAYGLPSDDEHVYPVTPDALPGGPYTDPIAQFDHNGAYAAIGSGFVYRGAGIPGLYGMYVFEDIVTGDAYYFDPATAVPGGPTQLYSLQFNLGGAPVELYTSSLGYGGDYTQRADARLSQLNDDELVIALKGTGDVLRLDALAVPEPATLALLLTLAVPALWRRVRD